MSATPPSPPSALSSASSSSLSEAELYAESLHFLEEHERALGMDARSILEQRFGLRLPPDVPNDKALLAGVLVELMRVRQVRSKLGEVNTLEDVVRLIEGSSRVLVLCGAGMSTAVGIPDFRSKGGIYERIRQRYPFLDDPQLLFDIHQFRLDPRPFFELALELLPATDDALRPSVSHCFVAELERRGKLLRCYTQNIDGLERRAGVQRVVFCHGNFDTVTCVRCGWHGALSDAVRECIRAGQVPCCERCRRLQADDEDADVEEVEPVLKPDIVFFGESLSDAFFGQIHDDLEATDLLLVLGTSLQVAPVAKIPTSIRPGVPQILINRELVARARVEFDVELLGDCDVVVAELARRLQWEMASMTPASAYTFHPPHRYLFPGAIPPANEEEEEELPVIDATLPASTSLPQPEHQ
ncbi:hypothetical protein CDCA_CDCA03G0817 [Cyanidium caldarium]|uniref:Deacetylase sirtuin-type domain-containing protein n=1 Tax=Cyanidium caldarium TaxID=2771 RepID=A0AAV9IQZ6_CYACA|nr:hypothetical protein CDCA_CDCA03G0817 [Cyanidium caldarium]